jgi:hypothetical protein
VLRDERVSGFIQSAATGAAEHLEQLGCGNCPFPSGHHVSGAGNGNRAHGEIDSGCESHGGDHHAELSGFGQGFHQLGALREGKTAVVVGDA